MFKYTKGTFTNGVPIPVCPQGCAVHHLACTAQPKGYTAMGQAFIFARMEKWNTASQNATLVQTISHGSNVFENYRST